MRVQALDHLKKSILKETHLVNVVSQVDSQIVNEIGRHVFFIQGMITHDDYIQCRHNQ